jgi:hypothetical protein
VNLARNVGLKTKFVSTIEIEWFANADLVDIWNVSATKIVRNVGNFSNDGFYIGQVFDYITDWTSDNTTPIEFNATITSISLDGSTMTFSVNSGAPTTGVMENVGIRALAGNQANYLTGLFYKFGLIENSEPFTFQSKITDSDNVYYADNVGSGVIRSTDFVVMDWQGTNKGGQTGSAQVRFASNTTYSQTFEVEHIFIIAPYYLDGQLSDIQNNIYPDYLEGDASLKHAYQLDFRLSLSNPNTSIAQIVDNVLGSVGWFNESLNGLNSDYEILSISYQDANSLEPVNSLQYNSKTRATISINKLSGSFIGGEKVGLFVSYLPSQVEYQNTISNFADNFLYDVVYYEEGNPPTVGNGIIKVISSNVSGGNLVIVADFEYTALQQAVLSADSSYLIGVEAANSVLTNLSTDSVVLLADLANYSEVSILSSLISFPKFNILGHDQQLGVDTGSNTVLVWNEDGMLLDFEFDINLNKGALLNSLDFKLVALNTITNTFFELDSFTFDLSNVVISSGVQQIIINQNRGYQLNEGSQFNNAVINIGVNNGGFQKYTGSLGQKISWESWLRNSNADPVFFKANEPNNGLNFKSSNYSNVENYQIRILATGNVSGLDDLNRQINGSFSFFSGDIDSFDYNKDGNNTPVWSAFIDTFNEDGTVSFGGAISNEQNTLFRVVWSQDNPVTTLPNYVIHRTQPTGDSGRSIYELSSIRPPLQQDNPLIPIDGESLTNVYLLNGDVVSECLIDYTKLNGVNWRLSAKIKSNG